MPLNLFDQDLAFDVVFSDCGGRWKDSKQEQAFHSPFLQEIENFPQTMVEMAKGILSNSPNNADLLFPEMCFGLIDGQTLNCYASRVGNRYFVGISVLMPIALLELSSYFFRDPNFFPNLGDPSLSPIVGLDGIEEVPFFQIAQNRFSPLIAKDLSEDRAMRLHESICQMRGNAAHRDHETGLRITGGNYIRQMEGLVELILPRCPVRRRYAMLAARQVCMFFWLHEIAHITQGHLRTLQVRDGIAQSRLFELPDGFLPKQGGLACTSTDSTLFALELDADVDALVNTISMILRGLDGSDTGYPEWDSYESVKLFTFMVTATFGALAKRAERHQWSASLSHPPEKLRLVNIFKYLLHMSTKDPALNAAVLGGLDLAKEMQSRKLMRNLGGLFSISQQELAEVERLDQNRLAFPVAHQAFNYANLRIMLDSRLVESFST